MCYFKIESVNVVNSSEAKGKLYLLPLLAINCLDRGNHVKGQNREKVRNLYLRNTFV